MTNHIIHVFIYFYSGRRRFVSTEYYWKWWNIILFMCLLIFIAAAGAFFRLNIVENNKTLYYLCFYSSLKRPHAPFLIEYCRKWWQIILFTFLFRFITAAGAFFRLNIVGNYEKSYYYIFVLLFAAAGVFLLANIFKYLSVWAFCLVLVLRSGAQIYCDVAIWLYILIYIYIIYVHIYIYVYIYIYMVVSPWLSSQEKRKDRHS